MGPEEEEGQDRDKERHESGEGHHAHPLFIPQPSMAPLFPLLQAALLCWAEKPSNCLTLPAWLGSEIDGFRIVKSRVHDWNVTWTGDGDWWILRPLDDRCLSASVKNEGLIRNVPCSHPLSLANPVNHWRVDGRGRLRSRVHGDRCLTALRCDRKEVGGNWCDPDVGGPAEEKGDILPGGRVALRGCTYPVAQEFVLAPTPSPVPEYEKGEEEEEEGGEYEYGGGSNETVTLPPVPPPTLGNESPSPTSSPTILYPPTSLPTILYPPSAVVTPSPVDGPPCPVTTPDCAGVGWDDLCTAFVISGLEKDKPQCSCPNHDHPEGTAALVLGVLALLLFLILLGTIWYFRRSRMGGGGGRGEEATPSSSPRENPSPSTGSGQVQTP